MIKKTSFFKKVRQKVIVSIIKSKRFKLHKSIIICSYPRSGSTWLTEIFGSIDGMIVNWEPLHVKFGVVPDKYFLGETPSLYPNSQNTDVYEFFFREVLTYKRFNKHSTWYVGAKKVLSSKYVVTKFCRANMLLEWMTQTFEFEYKPILLLRHPIPTVLSILKSWHNDSRDILHFNKLPSTLNNERYREYLDYINGLDTRIEQQVALWCLEHESLLKKEKVSWQVVFYENILQNPKTELSQIFRSWNFNIFKKNFEQLDFNKTSRSVYYKDELKKDTSLQVEKYLKKIDTKELDGIQKVLDTFEIKVYKAYSPYPVMT